MLSILGKSKSVLNTNCVRYLAVRYQSTETKPLEKTNDKVSPKKRFVKKKSFQKLERPPENFVNNLFTGAFDKNIFQYPSVLQENEKDQLVKHSLEIDNCVNNFSKKYNTINGEVVKSLREVEFFGLSIPQKYGGLGYSATETQLIQECSGIDSKLGLLLNHNENFGTKILTLYGSEEQKQKYLPRIAAGESLVTVAYLEDGPLVDLTSYKGVAIFNKEQDSFVINAKKKWVLNAGLSDLIILFVKMSPTFDEGEDFMLKYSLFIIEKDTPGIKILEHKSENAKEFGLCALEFLNYKVGRDNLITGKFNGYEMLKNALSYSELGSATLCLSMIKKLIFSAAQYSSEKDFSGKSLKEFGYIYSSLATMTTHAYALESMIYLLSGRCDLYNLPDLSTEANVVKIFAVQTLEIVIKNYIQVLGLESYNLSRELNEALRTLQFHSVLDESLVHLKMMVASQGLFYASKAMKEVIREMTTPHEYPLKAYLWIFTPNERKKKCDLKLKMELHSSLMKPADNLESCIGELKVAVKEMLFQHGSLSVDEEPKLVKLADMAAYIYALTACLARASTSYCNAEKNSEYDLNTTILFGEIALAKVRHFNEQVDLGAYLPGFYKEVGLLAMEKKEYPIAHPLFRAY